MSKLSHSCLLIMGRWLSWLSYVKLFFCCIGELRYWRSGLFPFPVYSPLSFMDLPQSHLTPQQFLEELHFWGTPLLLHPLADATGLPPIAAPGPAVHPYKAWAVL